MDVNRVRHGIAAGAATIGVLAGTPLTANANAAPAADDTAPLTVVATAPIVSSAGRAAPVVVAVTNSENQLLCSGVTVTLTWWRPDDARHSLSQGVPNHLGVATTTMHLPAAAMRRGSVRYYTTATQQCGLLAPTTTYEGRWPANGSAAVTVL